MLVILIFSLHTAVITQIVTQEETDGRASWFLPLSIGYIWSRDIDLILRL